MTRAAHCVGCGKTFDKMHLMINHRRLDRCGGRFLPITERLLLNQARFHFKIWMNIPAATTKDIKIFDHWRWNYNQYRDYIHRFHLLRKRRLDAQRT